jgi:O-antigen/teichoic acid export membrane protein
MKVKVDVVVLGVLVVLVLSIAPGHGFWGWALALGGAVVVGAVIGIVGRRHQWIYGQRRTAGRGRRR